MARYRFIGGLLAGIAFSSAGCDGGDTSTTSSGGGGQGGAGGAPATTSTGGSSCVVVDDGNECTDDGCDGAIPIHPPSAAGSPCTAGGNVCDGMGLCVECVGPTDCPGEDTACQSRTCMQSVCGTSLTPAGTPLPVQGSAGDCQREVCDGQGAVMTQVDNTDLPADNKVCTDDVCQAGVPSNPATPQGTSCGGGLICDGLGACVGCDAPADCPGDDNECQARTCTAGVCGFAFTAAGTPLVAQTLHDCATAVCDGNGGVMNLPNNADLPLDDGSACTDETCVAGMLAHPAKADGTACSDGDACTLADTCQAGVCVFQSTVMCNANTVCVAGACAACKHTLLGPRPWPVGPSPTSVATADLNGDGKLDLAVTNLGNATVSVLLNQGNSSFAAKVDYAVGTFPRSVAAADFNGDGKPDLVVANDATNNVSVLINNGNGTFAAKVDYPVGVSPYWVDAADLDGDGKAEIAVAADLGGSGRVVVLSYSLNPTIAIFPPPPPTFGYNPVASFYGIEDSNFRGGSSVAIADMSGDGRADLLVGAGFGGGPRVAIYEGKSVTQANPTRVINDFFAIPDLAFRGGVSIDAGDVDGDGRADLIVGPGFGGGQRARVLSSVDIAANKAATAAPLADFFLGGTDGGNRLGLIVSYEAPYDSNPFGGFTLFAYSTKLIEGKLTIAGGVGFVGRDFPKAPGVVPDLDERAFVQ